MRSSSQICLSASDSLFILVVSLPFYDIDQTDGGHEFLTISPGSGTPLWSGASTPKALQKGEGSVTPWYSERGNVAGFGGFAFTADWDTAITFYFVKSAEFFQFTYDTAAGAGGRDFQFGNMFPSIHLWGASMLSSAAGNNFWLPCRLSRVRKSWRGKHEPWAASEAVRLCGCYLVHSDVCVQC